MKTVRVKRELDRALRNVKKNALNPQDSKKKRAR
jgi:hypothetical protein